MNNVLIVDDERSMRITLSEFLKIEGFNVDVAEDVNIACEMIKEKDYDVILTDIIMPRLSGMELLSRVRNKNKTTQVIIMTGEPTVETAILAVQEGANDYLSKPINKDILIRAVRNASKIKQLNDENDILEEKNREYQKNLEAIVNIRTQSLQGAMKSIISLLSSVVEIRDPYTAGHQRRVGNLASKIATKLGFEQETINYILIIGYIHDIGKIVIPIEILSKPGVLSWLEMALIRNHPQSGFEMLEKVGLPEIIGRTIYQHHERCDGSGYPDAISSDKITIEAQVIMVADVVEAMISHRPYRPSLGLQAALDEIRTNSGTKFNKDVVNACIELFTNDNYEIDDNVYTINFPI